MPLIDQEIEALHRRARKELLDDWRRVYRSEPPPLSADLLRRAIAYRLQELAYGGLSPETVRELRRLASQGEAAPASTKRHTTMRAGTRLLREWQGKTYVVTATEEGFDHDGQTYGSLSQIARTITGTPWSGPKFFGLKTKAASEAPDAR